MIVDAMGGDNAPNEIIKGSIDALNEENIQLLLVGNEELIVKELEKYNYEKDKLEILNASDIITNDDDPAIAIRRKKDSSMVVGLKALKEGKGDAFISAGNTGAILAGGLFIVKRIPGVERAALTSVYPTVKGNVLLVDAGANVDTKAEFLRQFGIMGSIYMENIREITNPKVGLVNIGIEEAKGNAVTKEAYTLLKETDINFIGNIEGRDIPAGIADVIVADGFVGNVVLKLTEGMASSIFSILKEIFMTNTKTKLAALLIKPQLEELKAFMDYREYGSAPLLGVTKPVFKAHGSSDAYAFKNGIKHLINFHGKDITGIIEERFKI